MDIIDIVHQLRVELWGYQLTEWQQNLFSVRWWSVIAAIAAAYAIWWKYVDKRRLSEILLYGSFVAVCRTIMDDVGASAGLWVYSVKPLPLGHSLFLNDLTVVPLGFMLVYQYCQTWKKFLLWSVIANAAFAFVLLPVLAAFDILRLYNWYYHYSFFLVLIIVVVMRAVILMVLEIEKQHDFAYSSKILTPTMQPAMKPLDEEEDSQRRKDD